MSAVVVGRWRVVSTEKGTIELSQGRAKTNSSGTASVTSDNYRARTGDQFEFTVTGVIHKNAESIVTKSAKVSSLPIP